MNLFSIQRSDIDSSINFVKKNPVTGGTIECRYVSREDNQVIVYLSSQHGCDKACRMCHLTQTGQTNMTDVTLYGFVEQLKTVLATSLRNHENENRKLNINFMARGEPLANKFVIEQWPVLRDLLLFNALYYGFKEENIKFNISSIIPFEMENLKAENVLPETSDTYLYWSFYSTNNDFRKRWLPKSMPIYDAVRFIGNYKNLVLHMAFIKDQNDTDEDLKNLKLFIHNHFDRPKFNIVRYNPYSSKQGEESDRIDHILKYLSDVCDMQLVPRVGFDVAASCGMFVK